MKTVWVVTTIDGAVEAIFSTYALALDYVKMKKAKKYLYSLYIDEWVVDGWEE